VSGVEDPTSRADLIALVDLNQDEAHEVCTAMENVGLSPVQWPLGTAANDTGIQRAAVRIFVPRSQLRDARAVVAGVLPEFRTEPNPPPTGPRAEDRAWAEIVNELRAEGVGEHKVPGDEPQPPAEPGYLPPPAPPVSRPSRPALGSIALLVTGLVIAFLATARDSGSTTVLIGVAMCAAGFGGLILRLRNDRDDDHPDGAVV